MRVHDSRQRIEMLQAWIARKCARILYGASTLGRAAAVLQAAAVEAIAFAEQLLRECHRLCGLTEGRTGRAHGSPGARVAATHRGFVDRVYSTIEVLGLDYRSSGRD